MGRSTEGVSGRSLAMTYNSLSKVLLALRNSAPATAAVPGPTGAAAAALAVGSQTGLQQLQHVPWRDSALTRWLQERLHAAQAITLVGTVSAAAEVGAGLPGPASYASYCLICSPHALLAHCSFAEGWCMQLTDSWPVCVLPGRLQLTLWPPSVG